MRDRTDEDGPSEEPRDRARRRLIKLGLYIGPSIVAMTTFLRRGDAKPTQVPTVVPGAGPGPGTTPTPDAQATVNPQ